MDAGKPIPRVELRFFGGRRELNLEEAMMLQDLLRLEQNSAAHNLAPRITAATITGDQVRVDSYELKALSALLSVTDVGENVGLMKLKETCASLTFLVSGGASRAT